MEFSWADLPDLTSLIRRLHAGDKEAERQFFRLGYQFLGKLAAKQLKGEPQSSDTSAQDLLHDVYLHRLRAWRGNVNDRNHYAALVCLALRNELCDRARRRGAQKRTLSVESPTNGCRPAATLSVEEILSLERELDRLAAVDERAAQVIRLRYYGGCSWLETAGALGATTRAVRNDGEFAANWLAQRLGRRFL